MMASKTPFMLFLQFLHFLLGHPRCPGDQIPSFLLCIATISQDDGDTASCVNCSDTSGKETWRGIPSLLIALGEKSAC